MDSVPDGPLDAEPRGFTSQEEQHAVLLAELDAAGVHLGTYDARIVQWLAGWDWSTVAVVASLIRRAAQ
ncbi:hypothetical protein [Streptomyces sp. HNM0574]|uniref:hypothetical protein n=1 Tax=Streptomyces sp. HNM0574 TaxID=2714954 RepID=UPI00146C6104|nr:hypothetical protein [Streptomyces sp. HNM0574]NLU68474.1 hypothetical protein [Streptomyces sp. HNM0574]